MPGKSNVEIIHLQKYWERTVAIKLEKTFCKEKLSRKVDQHWTNVISKDNLLYLSKLKETYKFIEKSSLKVKGEGEYCLEHPHTL